ncbi:hypothetical protein [Alicyclobacillus sp. ALC3]|uniref:hypothetical protein n=1 Tax=Alicyclobacillus sp. ALC3 TaxID=2796143 RepID=UPI0023792899|nr:hypothetical protein [Alicyclobacillus sp. ALC3]WDL95959.1 hypothetical protein JC200_16610 [Alicyclobacillus sp. ALC3]
MYYFMFEAEPKPDSPERETSDGAFINCWVRDNDDQSALEQATRYIEAQGWEIIRVEEQCVAERDGYVDDDELPESLVAFNHARQSGIAAVFYRWSEEQGDEG